jgi:single-strand DNA-binding protein
MLNKCVIMGRCAKDPEKRMTTSGVPVASVTLACDRDFKGKDGNKETDWIDVVAYRETANFLSNYFTKGRMAVVSGRLQIRNYTDKDGNNRRAAEIVADSVYFGDSKNSNTGGSVDNTVVTTSNYTAPASDFAMLDGDDAQLPF